MDASSSDFDFIHAAFSLQYDEHWQDLIEKFASLNPQYILLEDLVVKGEDDFSQCNLIGARPFLIGFWGCRNYSKNYHVPATKNWLDTHVYLLYLESSSYLKWVTFRKRINFVIHRASC